MPDVDMLDKLAKIGQLINGIGVASAAVTAWVTFLFFQRRERDNRWIDGFRTLYSEYWKDKQIVEARRWIINDQLYDSILRPALRARLATGEKRNTLSQAQNEVLEKIDLLCSLMVRVKSFEEYHWIYMTPLQRTLFSKLMGDYPIMRLAFLHGRNELKSYVLEYWSELHADLAPSPKKRKIA